RTPFPGNIIPQSRIDPAWNKLVQLFPSPNQPVLSGTQPTNDYFYDTVAHRPTDQGDARVDYRLSDKDNLFGSVSIGNTDLMTQPIFSTALDHGGAIDGFDLTRAAQLSYSRVWSPTLVTESRLSFSRLVSFRHSATTGTDELQAFGIGGYDYTNTLWQGGGLPGMTIGSGATAYSAIGVGGGGGAEYNNVLDLVQNVAVSRGSH